MTSFRGRLTLWLLLGIGLLLTTGGLLLDRVITARLRRDDDAALIAEAKSLMAATEQQQDGVVSLELRDGFLPEFAPGRRPDYFELWRAGGSAFARSPSLGNRHLPRAAAPAGRFQLDGVTLPDGRRGRRVEITFPPQVEGEDERKGGDDAPPSSLAAAGGPAVTLVVARGSEELDSFLASLHLTLAFFILALLVGSAILVKAVVGVGLRPLDDLARRLAAIDADSLGEVVVIENAPAELLPAIAHLNGLLARLEESFDRERTFSANLAHELRTPLAELRAVTEVALKWPDDTSSWLSSFGEIHGIGLQMEKVVVNLLALARCDGKQYTVRASKVCLREIAESCWSAVAAEAEDKGLAIAVEIADRLTVVTDREKLELILSNLFSNAVAYGSPGSRIICSAAASGGEFALRVANRTSGLTPGELPLIFNRFWRTDAARSDGRHAGLGLSLVAALCELLGFTKEARLHGDVFEITLSGPIDGA